MNEDFLSPNHDERKGARIDYLIMHYTGMQNGVDALQRLSDPDSKVSAHYTVDVDGTIYRHVDEMRRAWHAGASYWQGGTDLNTSSIGIEIINPGHEWGYVPFSRAQMESVRDLSLDIMARHDIAPEHVLGHSDIAPSRKNDPGELFPWKELSSYGIGLWPEPSDDDVVLGAGINVERAMHDFGYDPRVKFLENIIAFQRHYVPEVFEKQQQGIIGSLTRTRLYALLAGHYLVPSEAK